MSGVFGNTLSSGSMPSGNASYGYRMGYSAPASTVSITPTTGPTTQSEDPKSKYLALFGYPARPEARDPEENRNSDHYTMPAAFLGRNVFLEQLIITQISEDEQWPIRKALTLARNEKGLTIEWDQFIFNDSLLDRTPEESVSRFLSSKSTGGSAAMLRMGIGLQWEDGFLATPRGQLWFATSMLQITNASVETCCAGVMVTLMTFDPKQFPVFMRNESFQVGSTVFLMGLLEEEKNYFAVLQRRAHGDRLLLSRLQALFQERNARGSAGQGNLLIIPGGSSQWYEFTHPAEFKYSETAKIGGPKPTTPQRLFQGIDTVESRAVLTGETEQRVDPFYSYYAIGDFFDFSFKHLEEVNPGDYRTKMMDLMAFSLVNNCFVVIRFDEMVAKSGLFVIETREATDRPDYYTGVGGHKGAFSVAPSSPTETWSLSTMGVKFFAGSRSWGEFIKSKCRSSNSIQLITNAIVRDKATYASFIDTFFPSGAPAHTTERKRGGGGGGGDDDEDEDGTGEGAEAEPEEKDAGEAKVAKMLAKFERFGENKQKPTLSTFLVRTVARNMSWSLKKDGQDPTKSRHLLSLLVLKEKEAEALLTSIAKNGGDTIADATNTANLGTFLSKAGDGELFKANVLLSPWGAKLKYKQTGVIGNQQFISNDAPSSEVKADQVAELKLAAAKAMGYAASLVLSAGVADGDQGKIKAAAEEFKAFLEKSPAIAKAVLVLAKAADSVHAAHAHFGYLVDRVYRDLRVSLEAGTLNFASTASAWTGYVYRKSANDWAPGAAGLSGHSFRIREKARRDRAASQPGSDKKAKKYVAVYDDMETMDNTTWDKLKAAAPTLYTDAGLADSLNHFALRHLAKLGGVVNDNKSGELTLEQMQSLFHNLQALLLDKDQVTGSNNEHERQQWVLAVLDAFFEDASVMEKYFTGTAEGQAVFKTDYAEDAAWRKIGYTELANLGKAVAAADDKERGDVTTDLHKRTKWGADEKKRQHRGDSAGFRPSSGYKKPARPDADDDEPTANDIEYALDNLPIADGDFVRWGLLYNIPPVLKIRGCRPEIVYEMGTAILMKGGGAAGNVFFGHQNVTIGADAMRKMGNLHYTLYNKCLLLNPAAVVHSFCCNSRKYVGGGDHDICDSTSSAQQARKTRGERPGSIYSVPVYLDENTEDDMVAEMTGRFVPELYLPGTGKNGIGRSRPLMQSFVARKWGITRPIDPRNRRMYGGLDNPANNTILCRAAHYRYNPNTKLFDVEILSNGHWGQNWYNGCADVHNARVAVPLENRRGPYQRPDNGTVMVSISK